MASGDSSDQTTIAGIEPSRLWRESLEAQSTSWLTFGPESELITISDSLPSMLRGTQLSLVNGRLRAECPVQMQLDQAMHKVFSEPCSPPDGHAATLVIGQSWEARVVLQILWSTNADGERYGMLLLRRPSWRTDNAKRQVQAQYRLTSREADLVLHLVEGGGTQAFRRQYQVGQETVKSHLKQIYRKMSCHSQLQVAAITHRILS